MRPNALTRHPGLVPGPKVPRATDKRLQLFIQPLVGPRHKAGVTVGVLASVGNLA
jgi:hypothetical protein